jgi:hypothetical protein
LSHSASIRHYPITRTMEVLARLLTCQGAERRALRDSVTRSGTDNAVSASGVHPKQRTLWPRGSATAPEPGRDIEGARSAGRSNFSASILGRISRLWSRLPVRFEAASRLAAAMGLWLIAPRHTPVLPVLTEGCSPINSSNRAQSCWGREALDSG